MIHVFPFPSGALRALTGVPDDVRRIELWGPSGAPEPTVFVRPPLGGACGQVVWRPLNTAQLAVAEAERAAACNPAPPSPPRSRPTTPAEASSLAVVEFAPGELAGIPQPHRSRYFLLRCAHALKPRQVVVLSRELLLAVLGDGPA